MATLSLQELQQEVEVIVSNPEIGRYFGEEMKKIFDSFPDEIFASEGFSREEVSRADLFRQIVFLRKVVYGKCLQRRVSEDSLKQMKAFIEATEMMIRWLPQKEEL